LSKIENGQMSPTYEALKKLAEGLAISVPQLFHRAVPRADQWPHGRDPFGRRVKAIRP
jgi:transcriptional regulator with XRE-family HTH domain